MFIVSSVLFNFLSFLFSANTNTNLHIQFCCEQQSDSLVMYCVCLCITPGGGGLLQHPEGVQLPLCEEGAHFCEGERGTAHIFSEGKRQTRLIYQWLFCHSTTPGGRQLRTTLTDTQTHKRTHYTTITSGV